MEILAKIDNSVKISETMPFFSQQSFKGVLKYQDKFQNIMLLKSVQNTKENTPKNDTISQYFRPKTLKIGLSLIFLWMFNAKQCNQGKILGIIIFLSPQM